MRAMGIICFKKRKIVGVGDDDEGKEGNGDKRKGREVCKN